MSKEDLGYFESLINEKKTELLKELGHLREPGLSGNKGVEDHTPYSFHMADQGTDNMEREKKYFFAGREGKLLDYLDRALERIKEKTYGMCRGCGKMINPERLKAVPHATLCIECKSKQERI
ncbi:MAG: TraR/DksA family transcriptional regulator [Calditrichaeota bacterium]|nr:MAG: TraR/DksA family transcriptional regulator [Calditrichota bacterium]